MSHVTLGVISGVAFGALSVGLMLPIPFPDKRAALLGAFTNRFGIGFVICVAGLSWPGWAAGLFFGLLLSLPAALVTKAYAPILGIGGVGGLIIGALVPRLAS